MTRGSHAVWWRSPDAQKWADSKHKCAGQLVRPTSSWGVARVPESPQAHVAGICYASIDLESAITSGKQHAWKPFDRVDQRRTGPTDQSRSTTEPQNLPMQVSLCAVGRADSLTSMIVTRASDFGHSVLPADILLRRHRGLQPLGRSIAERSTTLCGVWNAAVR